MNHGDLVPGNVLVERGRLVGIIDVGGFGPADPALDLVAGWHLLAEGPRRVLRSALGSDDLEWARGTAWAFAEAIGLVWYYAESNAPVSRWGRRTLLARSFDEPAAAQLNPGAGGGCGRGVES